jgi:hypothetical protein
VAVQREAVGPELRARERPPHLVEAVARRGKQLRLAALEVDQQVEGSLAMPPASRSRELDGERRPRWSGQ